MSKKIKYRLNVDYFNAKLLEKGWTPSVFHRKSKVTRQTIWYMSLPADDPKFQGAGQITLDKFKMVFPEENLSNMFFLV